ncbi:MAG: UDP-N-acetylmuramate--L-alanine ligase [Firmicutes bacterium]|nr:UDP-N-acetylmuramate--L-alanine ligase [Bacillota bacterium]
MVKHYHFVGIGGISMSALALILHKQGIVVSGSDINENEQTVELRKYDVMVFIGHNVVNISSSVTNLVINGAISNDNPELVIAKERGLEIVDRSVLLAEISKSYKNVIAVAGTSGKSTTTAMIGAIFVEAELLPTVHNGAVLMSGSGGLGLVQGSDEYFITEACEFKRSFLTLRPRISVITNVNPDHMDCYDDFDDLKKTFFDFGFGSGKVIVNNDCKNSKLISTNFANAVTIGIKNKADIMATDIIEYKRGKYKFTVAVNSTKFDIQLNVFGYHNIYNALAAIAVGVEFGVQPDVIAKALYYYKGIARRFEEITQIGKTKIISDYAHHPIEVATTIKTCSKLFDKFLVVFQPHTYSRTKALFNEFKEVLGNCNVVLYKTYSAREKPIKGGSAHDLAKSLGMKYFSTKTALEKFVDKNIEKYDAVIFVGAGDIDLIARSFN